MPVEYATSWGHLAVSAIEIAGLGPAPFAAMMLADHGTEVIRVERPGTGHAPLDPLLRSRKSVVLDLKSPDDVARLRALCRTADGVIEGLRPGVMERSASVPTCCSPTRRTSSTAA